MDQGGSMDVYEDFQTRSLSSIGKKGSDEREFQYRSTVQAIRTIQQKINLKISFDLLKNTQDYEKLLKDLRYQQIRFIAKGSQSYAFKAINVKNQIVAVKVCKNTEESLKAITMQQQINNDKARNMNESTILQYNVIVIEDILITEEDLAQLTLEDLLQQRAIHQQKFSLQEIKAICFDLIDQLYILHTKGQSAHNDIKPENIMIQNGKFILHDYGAATYVPKSEMELLNQVVGTILYMSPLKLQHFQECGQSVDLSGTFQYEAKSDISHNPFKSDIYSLGMVILRLLLHNEDFTTLVQIENIFYHNRSTLLPLMIQKYPFYFKLERFIYNKQQNKFLEVMNLLELMLKEDEQERINTVDLALMVDVNIFAGVETPYTNIFIPKISEIDIGYRVIYSLNHLIYEGQLNPQTHERQGVGSLFKPKMIEQLSNKQYADLYQKYRRDKKNNTILEEEEIDYDVSDITQAPTESQFSQRQSILGNNKFQILYEGGWSKDIPNDHGKLNCYNAINIKGSSHKQSDVDFEELNFSIESDILYGYLNGQALIKQQQNQFIVNINTQYMKTIDYQKYEKQYILFQEEEISGNIYGYVHDHNQITIDLSQVQDRDGLIEIVSSFCQVIQPQEISYTKDQDYQSLLLQSDDKKLEFILKKPFLVRKRREIQLQTKEGSSLLCCVQQQQKKSERSSQVSEISEACDLISEVLMTVFEKTQLNNLKCINLFDCMFNDQTFMVLIQQDKPMKVEELDLSGCLISDQMMALIISSSIVYYTKVLKISHTACGQETVNAMIASDKFNQLQKLSISQCSSMKCIEQYIQTDKAQRLALLDISHNKWVNDEFMKSINLVYLPNLRTINLYNCAQLNSRSINNFKQSPIGQKVNIMVNTQNLLQVPINRQQFNLEYSIGQKLIQLQKGQQHSKIFDDTLKILSHSQGLSSVESLNLRDQQITHYGLGNLISSQYVYIIHTIDCSNTLIKGDIFRIICQSKLNSLRHLIFQNCNQIVAQDVRDFVKNIKAAIIQTFQISSALIPSKQIIRNLKQLYNLEDIWITFQKWDQDVPSEIKSLFSWCFNLLLSKKIKSLYLDVSLFPDSSEGFEQFMELASQLDINITIKADPNSIIARDLKLLRNVHVIE